MDLEETLLEKREEFKEVSIKVSGMLEKAPEMFYTAYEQLKAEEDKHAQMARDLEVPFTLRVPRQECEINLEQISINLETLKKKVSDIIAEAKFETPEKAITSATAMKDYGTIAKTVQDRQNSLYNMVKAYSDEAQTEAYRGVDERIQTIIRDTKLQLLAIKRQDLQERRISFWGRLFGAGQLKQIELDNLKLEESILKNTPIKQKTSYNIQDSLADMRAFVIKDLNDQNTNNTNAVLLSGMAVFGIPSEVIDEKAQRKLHSVPMVMTDVRRKPRTSERIAKAKQRNIDLEAEFLDVINSDKENKPQETELKGSRVVQEFSEILRITALETTDEKPREETVKNKGQSEKQNEVSKQNEKQDISKPEEHELS